MRRIMPRNAKTIWVRPFINADNGFALFGDSVELLANLQTITNKFQLASMGATDKTTMTAYVDEEYYSLFSKRSRVYVNTVPTNDDELAEDADFEVIDISYINNTYSFTLRGLNNG